MIGFDVYLVGQIQKVARYCYYYFSCFMVFLIIFGYFILCTVVSSLFEYGTPHIYDKY